MHNIPGTIEAASYEDATGNIAAQPTSDAGGGQNVGWIDYGTYMDYYVNVAQYGTYNVSFRVATTYSDASFELLDAGGNVLTKVTCPNTGGFQTWQTVNATAILPAGLQTIRIKSTSWDIWNINWMTFASATGAAAAASRVSTTTAASFTDSVATAATATQVWPNPVKGMVTIQVNDNTSGDEIIQVVDAMGNVRQTTKFTKLPGVSQFQLDLSTLAPGVYNIRILSTSRQQVVKILKV
jgi:endoglucanase